MNLLFKSHYFAAYQCDRKRCFYIDFGHKNVKMSLCQLLSLRQKVMNIDLESHFDEELNPHGIEIITLCNRDHLFVMDTLQIVDLRQLLKASFGILELNSLVAH